MSLFYRQLTETGMIDRATGEYLWANKLCAPRWYWRYRRLRLFASIVWRRWDEQCTRITWRTAWEVACGVYEYELPKPKEN